MFNISLSPSPDPSQGLPSYYNVSESSPGYPGSGHELGGEAVYPPGYSSFSDDLEDDLATVTIKDSHDHKGTGMTFEVCVTGTFKEAFNHFTAACCKGCKPVSDLRFKTDGVKLLHPDTLKKVGIRPSSTATILVYSNVSGLTCSTCKARGFSESRGVIKPGSAIRSHMPDPSSASADAISVVIEDQTLFRTIVRTMETSTLDSIMDVYADRAMRDRLHLRFFFEGERLDKRETPKELGMVNGDKIEVIIECTGG